MFDEINAVSSPLSLSCVPSLPPPSSLLCSPGQSSLLLSPVSCSPLQSRDCGPDRERPQSEFESNTHTWKHSCLLVSSLQRVWEVPGVCVWLEVGGCVCVFCVDDCGGVLRHFSWDIERCVCHSVGGRAIGGRAPLPSPWSSSSSSPCPSSPPRLRSLREPSTSPKTVSTPSPEHLRLWIKSWEVFHHSVFPFNNNLQSSLIW